jgi:hypothetical protein
MPTTLIYRMLKIRDPRTPGFHWYEIEARDTSTGRVETVAVCDTREEARATIAAMRQAVGQ